MGHKSASSHETDATGLEQVASASAAPAERAADPEDQRGVGGQRFLESWEPLREARPFPTEAEHQPVIRFLALRRQGDAMRLRRWAAGGMSLQEWRAERLPERQWRYGICWW